MNLSLLSLAPLSQAAVLLALELRLLLDWKVGRVKYRDRLVLARLRLWPFLGDGDGVAGAEELGLEGLGEDAAGGPAPDLAADGVDDDEVVGLAGGELHLDGAAAGVLDVEGEFHGAVALRDVEGGVE